METFKKIELQVWETKIDSKYKKCMVFQAHFFFCSLGSICLQKSGKTSSNQSN